LTRRDCFHYHQADFSKNLQMKILSLFLSRWLERGLSFERRHRYQKRDVFGIGNLACRMAVSLSIVAGVVATADCRRAAAEEAATAPTCTGCSSSKPEQSLSPRSRRTESRHTESRRGERASSRREPGGNIAIFDGNWSGTSTGSCIPNYNWSIHVSNGIISGQQSNGSVSRGGFVNAVMTVNGYLYKVVGRANGSAASGTWSTTGNCSGRWTASR
jgi:hypothetical protein